MSREKTAKCVCCGKPAFHGVPFSLCENCRDIVEKFLEVKREYEKTLMEIKNITPSIEFKTKNEDVDLFLKTAWELISEIELKLVFVKNNLLNIETELKMLYRKLIRRDESELLK